jgi:hypothetical protein
MAHFELNGKRISNETIGLFKRERITVGLWGAMNTLVSPPVEIDVTASPSDGATAERSKLPIANKVRKWDLTGLKAMKVTIAARVGMQTWDSFELDVRPPSYKFLRKEQQQFIEDLANAGRARAKEFDLPLSSMIACGCGESTFGTSDIYKRTGCPFNLQKPADWDYPKCDVEAHSTENKPGEDAKPAPFCKATNLAEAARLWCEWIVHYSEVGGKPTRGSARSQLLALRKDPKAFASNLFLVNFAASIRSRTEEFGNLLEQHELRRFD